jgi:hypothetical protein
MIASLLRDFWVMSGDEALSCQHRVLFGLEGNFQGIYRRASGWLSLMAFSFVDRVVYTVSSHVCYGIYTLYNRNSFVFTQYSYTYSSCCTVGPWIIMKNKNQMYSYANGLPLLAPLETAALRIRPRPRARGWKMDSPGFRHGVLEKGGVENLR